MKLNLWTLCVFYSCLVFAEDPFNNFATAPDNKAFGALSFTAPEEGKFTFGDFATDEKEPEMVNRDIFSVIDSGMNSRAETNSIGADYFTASKSLTGRSEEVPEAVYDVAPAAEWTGDEISGVSEVSVEDILSSRGFPLVTAESTSIDTLGLPKPQYFEYDTSNKTGESREEQNTVKEKAKAKFTDMFNGK